MCFKSSVYKVIIEENFIKTHTDIHTGKLKKLASVITKKNEPNEINGELSIIGSVSEVLGQCVGERIVFKTLNTSGPLQLHSQCHNWKVRKYIQATSATHEWEHQYACTFDLDTKVRWQ